MRHLFSSRLRVVLIVAILLSAGLAILSNATGHTLPDMMVEGFLAPFRYGAQSLTNSAEQFYSYMFNYETLAAEKLINQLHFDNGPCRFCPNVEPHMHVLDDSTNRVIDVQLKEGVSPEDVFELPEGVHIKSMEAYLRGEIPDNCMSDNQK